MERSLIRKEIVPFAALLGSLILATFIADKRASYLEQGLDDEAGAVLGCDHLRPDEKVACGAPAHHPGVRGSVNRMTKRASETTGTAWSVTAAPTRTRRSIDGVRAAMAAKAVIAVVNTTTERFE